MKKIATFVKDLSADFTGRAELFRVDPPMRGWGSDALTFGYVIASATGVLGKPETYLFGSNVGGDVVDWTELPGSQKGTLSIEEVLADAGYEVRR